MSATTAPAKVKRIFGVPVAVALFFIAMMLPTAVSVNLGGSAPVGLPGGADRDVPGRC